MSDEKNITTTEYTEFTRTTAIYPKHLAIEYLVLGLCSESGEVASLIKKSIRDNTDPDALRSNMLAEMGDVLWYVARICDEMGVSLDDLMLYNRRKLESRKTRGVIGGSGDHR